MHVRELALNIKSIPHPGRAFGAAALFFRLKLLRAVLPSVWRSGAFLKNLWFYQVGRR